ncbi:FecR family protein [Maribacter sp. 2307ULW6-5]|uniref:FecR family protein n=1 Tax=Maribacter sp. 2307ULW6-5 TaxID=3386275 RepID=UPI0039BD8277
MQENYLAKWLSGELTDAEKREFEQSEAFATYQKIAQTSQRYQAPEFDAEKAWSQLQAGQKGKTPKVFSLHPFRNFLKIAAAIAVLMGGAYVYLNSLDHSINTSLAEQTEVVLPDASEVLLNAASELSYAKDWETARRVTLSGEAFFKVAKGETFTVNTAQGQVRVLGTQFNVAQRKDYFEVSCYEGRVAVSVNGNDTTLEAGQGIRYLKGDKKMMQVSQNGAPAWVNSESSFDSMPLTYVLQEFERQYKVHVDAGTLDTSQRFTGTFTHTDMELALKSITVPLKISFTLEGNKVRLNAPSTP